MTKGTNELKMDRNTYKEKILESAGDIPEEKKVILAGYIDDLLDDIDKEMRDMGFPKDPNDGSNQENQKTEEEKKTDKIENHVEDEMEFGKPIYLGCYNVDKGECYIPSEKDFVKVETPLDRIPLHRGLPHWVYDLNEVGIPCRVFDNKVYITSNNIHVYAFDFDFMDSMFNEEDPDSELLLICAEGRLGWREDAMKKRGVVTFIDGKCTYEATVILLHEMVNILLNPDMREYILNDKHVPYDMMFNNPLSYYENSANGDIYETIKIKEAQEKSRIRGIRGRIDEHDLKRCEKLNQRGSVIIEGGN